MLPRWCWAGCCVTKDCCVKMKDKVTNKEGGGGGGGGGDTESGGLLNESTPGTN